MADIKFEAFRTNEDGSAVFIDAADLLAALGQLSTPEPENALGEERYDFTTTAGNAGLLMVYVTNGLGQHYRRANRADVTAALKEKGEHTIKLPTGSAGPTDALEPLQRFVDNMNAETFSARSVEIERELRAVIAQVAAGLALGEQKQAARVRELEQRVADLKFALGDGAGWFDRYKLAESELAATKVKLAEVERSRDLHSQGRQRLDRKERELLAEIDELTHELASARRVVEAVKAWKAAHAAWMKAGANASTRDIVAAEMGLDDALKALASAAPDADRTEASATERQPEVERDDGSEQE